MSRIPSPLFLKPLCTLKAALRSFSKHGGIILGRWVSANIVNVTRLAAFWKERAHSAGDDGADVTTLGDILCVTELEHEFVAGFSMLGYSKATL